MCEHHVVSCDVSCTLWGADEAAQSRAAWRHCGSDSTGSHMYHLCDANVIICSNTVTTQEQGTQCACEEASTPTLT